MSALLELGVFCYKAKIDKGTCKYFGDYPLVKAVQVNHPYAYDNDVPVYDRTLALVSVGEGAHYVLDLFRVKGGEFHDLAWHAPGKLQTSGLEFKPNWWYSFKRRYEDVDWSHSPLVTSAYFGLIKEVLFASPQDSFALDFQFENRRGLKISMCCKEETVTDVVKSLTSSPRTRKQDKEPPIVPLVFVRRFNPAGDLFASMLEPYNNQTVMSGFQEMDCEV